jgi:3-methylcrotonyl-CoA carboxylase alpha subunit
MLSKLLIANRGEIACRIAATARRLGVRTVAVYSDADAHSAHVEACDEAVYLGPSPARDSYLRTDLILAAAQATGAMAIHPGYGFLSENASFALACAQAGITFVGPPASAIEAMGDKAAAKRLMAQGGVPLVPGHHGPDQSVEALQAHADGIGYPVLIKACAGGGGKGMRIVQQACDFAQALASCQREAQASFGNAQVLLEKYLSRPRHIEVQVFADTYGQCVHLFERDCSVQRRHQKVLEEAPAPGMSTELRARLGQAAVQAALSVGYVGAGTVEFIAPHDVLQSGQFYFMEMNTRLQVEHPVTEAITGLDLVEWQLRVASGEHLPLRQDRIRFEGHAIEARVCAENPAQGFVPSTGKVHWLACPPATHFAPGPVRIDTGLRQGDTISPHYDAMVAKVIAHGKDRAEALQRLDAALQSLQIAGVHSNVDLLRCILATPAFAQGEVHTHLIDENHETLMAPPDAQAIDSACLSLAQHLVFESPAASQAPPDDDPWATRDGWRLHGPSRQRLHLQADGLGPTTRRTVLIEQQPEQPSRLQLLRAMDGQTQAAPGTAVLAHTTRVADTATTTNAAINTATHTVIEQAGSHGQRFDVFTPQGRITLQRLDPLTGQKRTEPLGGLRACMPGRVIAVEVAVGQRVEAGQRLAITEAMKMEHPLCAPHAGIVSELLCAVGDQVSEGQELLRVQASPPSPSDTATMKETP